MKDRARAMIMASFAADSLALGAHWIYSTGKISRDFGRIETFLTPGADSYHPTKKQGEFTHYGDQAVVLLESLAHKGRFEPEDFSQRWRQFFRDYTGYFDQAPKDTLKNISLGTDPLQAGSSSNDISGAARIAPVIYCLRNDGVELIKAVRTQTALTHTDPLTIDASEFFARVVLRTLEGNGVMPSIEEVSRTYPEGSLIRLLVKKGMDVLREEASRPSSPSARTAMPLTRCPPSSTSSAGTKRT
jgi:ADP-ribosylglycohydrolase